MTIREVLLRHLSRKVTLTLVAMALMCLVAVGGAFSKALAGELPIVVGGLRGCLGSYHTANVIDSKKEK